MVTFLLALFGSIQTVPIKKTFIHLRIIIQKLTFINLDLLDFNDI